MLAGDLWGSRTWHDGDVPAAGESYNTPAGVPCPVERLAFLQAAWPRMEIAVRQIEAAPPHVFQNDVRLVETAQARRVLPKQVLQALRSSGGEFVPVPSNANIPLANQLGGKLPRRVYESVVSLCFDTPANRAVKTVLVRFAHDLKTIAVLAAQNDLPDTAREAERLHLRVRRRLIAVPWRDLLPGRGFKR